jgi:collagenase-like PrtC family protease
MQLTVAANFDADLVPQLADYPVREVYGKFPVDSVGGGRPSYMGTPVSPRELQRYVALLRDHGVAFNYLLNAACLGNREWSRRWQRRLHRLLDGLWRMGVTHLTVSTPYLLEAVKRRFPQFRVKVGIYAQVDTPRRARFWADLGADGINLESFSINRDLRRLAAIRDAVDCDLQLIPNHPCLPNCPLQYYHQAGMAHASNGTGELFIDYCFLRCSRSRLRDPSLLIKSGWIRPEDLHVYEAMGYRTFKLLERGIPSEELLKRVKAYAGRNFDGNLAELLLPYGFRSPTRRARGWAIRHFFKPRAVSPFRVHRLMEAIRSQGMLFPIDRLPVTIDAGAIPDDFLDGFRTRDCAVADCGECGYCERIAERAVCVEPAFRERALSQFDEIDALLVGGGLWHAR